MSFLKKLKSIGLLVTGFNACFVLWGCSHSSPASEVSLKSPLNAVEKSEVITVRTQSYARPPYSGATYYLYEQDGNVICTKIKVCNKYNECETAYHSGHFRDEEETEDGVEPFEKTEPQVIPVEKIKLHRCLAQKV